MLTPGKYPMEEDYAQTKNDMRNLHTFTNSPAGTENLNSVGKDNGTLDGLIEQVLKYSQNASNKTIVDNFEQLPSNSEEYPAFAEVVNDADSSKNGLYWKESVSSSWDKTLTQPASEYRVGVAENTASIATIKADQGTKQFLYPNRDFYLTHGCETKINKNYKIIYRKVAHEVELTLLKSLVEFSAYPFRQFNSMSESIKIDGIGNVISSEYLQKNISSRINHYPHRDFHSTDLFKIVDSTGGIVNPDVLSPSSPKSEVEFDGGGIEIKWDKTTKVLITKWTHGEGKKLIVEHKPNGFNKLFNWAATRLEHEDGQVSLIQASSSDAWPPYVVKALNDVDETAPQIYTGGNHGSDGYSGGENTARMVDFRIEVENVDVTNANVTGFCNEVRLQWVNEVMAYNTITKGRYVLRQTIMALIKPGNTSAFVQVEALEPLQMLVDNGPQFFIQNYETFHFLDGVQKERLPIIPANSETSGVFSQNKAWATVLGSDLFGFHGAWVDRDFECGDGRYIRGTVGAFRKGTGSKFYSCIVSGQSADAILNQGETYEWHGGYFWSPISIVSGDADCAFIINRYGKKCLGYAQINAGIGKLNLEFIDKNAQIENVGVSGVTPVKIQSDGYKTFIENFKE